MQLFSSLTCSTSYRLSGRKNDKLLHYCKDFIMSQYSTKIVCEQANKKQLHVLSLQRPHCPFGGEKKHVRRKELKKFMRQELAIRGCRFSIIKFAKLFLERETTMCYYLRVIVCSFLIAGKAHVVGKNLKGQECDKGISRRKNGFYYA